jgi:Lrp/AsnC family transcriptional regulator
MTASMRLDAADIRILRIMQRDASLAVAEIAREAGMSQTPAWRRIKRLRDGGVISAIVAIIDSKAVGLGFIAYCFVKLTQPSRVNIETFDRMVESWPEVLVCDRITGAADRRQLSEIGAGAAAGGSLRSVQPRRDCGAAAAVLGAGRARRRIS